MAQLELAQINIFDVPKHHRNDPPASKIAGKNSVKFRLTHADKIRNLLRAYPNSTSKQLEIYSNGTLTHTQIDRRIHEMKDVYRSVNIESDGCHALKLVTNANNQQPTKE